MFLERLHVYTFNFPFRAKIFTRTRGTVVLACGRQMIFARHKKRRASGPISTGTLGIRLKLLALREPMTNRRQPPAAVRRKMKRDSTHFGSQGFHLV